jgi:hypothetical protein
VQDWSAANIAGTLPFMGVLFTKNAQNISAKYQNDARMAQGYCQFEALVKYRLINILVNSLNWRFMANSKTFLIIGPANIKRFTAVLLYMGLIF